MALTYLTKLYVDAVISGQRTIDTVPDTLRQDVISLLKERKDNA